MVARGGQRRAGERVDQRHARRLWASAALVAMGALLLASEPVPAEPPRPVFHELGIEGVINPITARYLLRGMAAAEEAGAEGVIVRLDTPGGTLESMRSMVRALLAAPVPVIVYVAPEGARAASAGVFITAAANVAAMAPGTHLGSAHPVSIGGGQSGGEVMEQKVVNDAAALARAIAAQRSRNAQWLEQAVRKSVSATAAEARALGVVDLVARDRAELLRNLDGRTVEIADRAHALKTSGATVEAHPMGLVGRILHAITDPNIAYILFSLGLLGLAAELYHPGLLFPGTIGGVSLLLALVAFGSLPVNWGGVALIVLGLALVVGDALSAGLGLLALGGVVALLLGSLFLYEPVDPPSVVMPDLSVHPALIASVCFLVVGFATVVVRALWRLRGQPPRAGTEALVGQPGTATAWQGDRGRVRIDSETWTAVSPDRDIAPGDRVWVAGVEGVTLQVRREATPGHAPNEEARR